MSKRRARAAPDPTMHRSVGAAEGMTVRGGKRQVCAGWGKPLAGRRPDAGVLRVAGRAFRTIWA